jgi:cytochrome c5
MSEQAQHSSFIKTPQQLVVVVVLAFVVPIFGIVMLVQLVVNRPHLDPAAMEPKAVAARIQPLGQVELGEPPAAPGARGGEEIVKAVCAACHGKPGIPTAPHMGDNAKWAPLAKQGLPKLVATAIKGTDKGMPPKGGAADLTDAEIARAIVFMVNQSGGSMKEPAAPAPAKAEAKKK